MVNGVALRKQHLVYEFHYKTYCSTCYICTMGLRCMGWGHKGSCMFSLRLQPTGRHTTALGQESMYLRNHCTDDFCHISLHSTHQTFEKKPQWPSNPMYHMVHSSGLKGIAQVHVHRICTLLWYPSDNYNRGTHVQLFLQSPARSSEERRSGHKTSYHFLFNSCKVRHF